MRELLQRKTQIITAAIIVIAFALRLPLLNGSLWLDEAAQVLESNRSLVQQLNIRDDFQPPFIHVLVHALLQVSHNEAWLRFGAALFPALVTLWVVIHIGQKYFSPMSGWLAGILLATSSFHIFYSQELRPYSLPAMFAALSWLMMFKAFHQKKPTTQDLVLFAIWTVGGLYSSYLYPFVLLGQAIYVISQCWKSFHTLRPWLISAVVAVLAFIPWLPSLYGQLSAGQQLRQQFAGWEKVVSFDQIKSISLVGGKFIFGVLDLTLNLQFLALFGVICGFIAALVWTTKSRENMRKLLALGCWLVMPILLAWIVSFWVPVIQPKRVLFALPAFYLLIGNAVSAAQKKSTGIRWLSYGTFAILLFINLFSTWSYFTQSKYQRENWREIQQYITQKYDPHKSVVLFAFTNQFASWEWYNKGAFPTVSTQVFTVSEDPESPERLRIKQLTDYQYILVFDYLRDLTDPHHLIEADLTRYGYQQVDVIPGNAALGQIRVFARTRQIIGYSEY